jgi:mannose-1-phosphate guanylyltransferase
MKGMILAAGLGTRMGPISRYMAKPVVPFLGVPMIEHSIQVLRSAGIREIVVNTHHLPETVRAVLGDGSRLGVSISYSHEDPILGTGGGIGNVRRFFDGETFIVINSDVIIDIDASQALATHRASGAATTLVLRPDPENRYGKVLIDKDQRIVQIEGSPSGSGGNATAWRSDCMFAGLHVIEPRWFDFAPPRPIYDSVRDVYSAMIAAGELIQGHIFTGRWIDIGSARRLLNATAKHLSLHGGNIIPDPKVIEGSTVERCVLHQNVRIGRNCRLRDVVFLGGAELGRECTLSSCIVCPGTNLQEGFQAEEAVIAGSEVTQLSGLRE